MTRIPHESPELERWLAEAKQADVALTPGPAELESLGARLSSLHTGTALLGAPAAKVIVGIGTAALLGGVAVHSAVGSHATAKNTHPVAAAVSAPALATVSSASTSGLKFTRSPAPDPSANDSAPLKEASLASKRTPANESLDPPHVPRSDSRPRATWIEVNEALSAGDVSAARSALENIIARSGGAAKERAELAWAQLELGGPRAGRANATLQRLARSAREPSVRQRAQSVLGSSN